MTNELSKEEKDFLVNFPEALRSLAESINNLAKIADNVCTKTINCNADGYDWNNHSNKFVDPRKSKNPKMFAEYKKERRRK